MNVEMMDERSLAKEFMMWMWVVMLEGKDFLTKLVKFREGPDQEYPKPV
jgi:hypothetical protein